jgi:hypothetical protein
MSTKSHTDTKAIKAEITALQDERVAHEDVMRQRMTELHEKRQIEDAKLQDDWHGGLREIDVKIRNASTRLQHAQADEHKAAAAAAIAEREKPARIEKAAAHG